MRMCTGPSKIVMGTDCFHGANVVIGAVGSLNFEPACRSK